MSLREVANIPFAVLSMASPLWLSSVEHALQEVSTVAAALFPVIGLVLAIVQIRYYWNRKS